MADSPSFLPPNHADTHATTRPNTNAHENTNASINTNAKDNADEKASIKASVNPKSNSAKLSTDHADSIANPIERLIRRLARLPGLGPRSARRVALHLISNKENVMHPLVEDMADVAHTIRLCAECGNWDTSTICSICRDPQRDKSTICVVEQVADLWAMERAGVFGGYYHVLGGVLSAIDGVGPDALRINQLVTRLVKSKEIKEVILALSTTVDGQATAHYIVDCIADLPIKRTRLAQGVPVGGELDYLDDGTLAQALKARAVI